MAKKTDKADIPTNMAGKPADNVDVPAMIDRLVKNAGEALEAYMEMDQAQVDAMTHAMTLAGLDDHMRLAQLAVEETGRGVLEDKVIKNIFATGTSGTASRTRRRWAYWTKELEGYVEVAEPVGIIAGVTPVTGRHHHDVQA